MGWDGKPGGRGLDRVLTLVVCGFGTGVPGAAGEALTWPGHAIGLGVVQEQETTDDLEELAARATAAVVLVEVRSGDDSRQGSGFLVDPSGVILTNYHVIRDATSARVRLSSGDLYEYVTVLSVDERRDIAVLKIPGFGLPALEMGNSDAVRIGATAIAIGSPMGLENTVSTGIVSGRRQEPEGYQLLQITTPASAGSSGGPVLSRDGRVIGIAASQLRGGQNLNFAVPINYARGMLSEPGREPLAVLGPEERRPAREAVDMAAGSAQVNRGLRYDLSDLEEGYRLYLEARLPGGSIRTTRVTLRPIDDIAGGASRLERYLESETDLQRGELGPPLTIRRERSRTIVGASDLRPVSARGQVDWLVEGVWRQVAYDLRFEGGRARGTVQDSAGVITQVDRDLPEGILLREMRDVAFGALVADQLTGRSVEFVTFDASTAQVTSDRFDVRGRTTVDLRGQQHEALVVDVASGLVNERVLFTLTIPRTLLRRESSQDGEVEEVVGLHPIPAPEGGGDR